MEFTYSQLISETRNAINSRLDMLEQMMRNTAKPDNKYAAPDNKLQEFINNQHNTNELLKSQIQILESEIVQLKNKEVLPTLTINSNDEMMEASSEKAVEIMRSHTHDLVDSVIVKIQKEEEVVEEEQVEEEEAEEEMEEEEAEEEEAEEEEAEEEDQDQDQEEEQELELEEFEYKGITLYRDSEKQVYRMDEDGALSDPIGIWDEVKQRIKKIV